MQSFMAAAMGGAVGPGVAGFGGAAGAGMPNANGLNGHVPPHGVQHH
jgi:hypothetical protein